MSAPQNNAPWREFQYSVLRYCHDSVAEEQLNVGVAFYTPDVPFLRVQMITGTQRLGCAFADFDPDNYRAVVRQVREFVAEFNEAYRPTNILTDTPPEHLENLLVQMWPDQGLSYRYGRVRTGLCPRVEDRKLQIDVLEEEVLDLLDNLVRDQEENPERLKRTDEDLWVAYRRVLSEISVTTQLKPVVIKVSGFEYEFHHAFPNRATGRWNVVLPVSLDYIRKGDMKARIARLRGDADILSESDEIEMMNVLLGRPTRESFQASYEQSVRLLHKMSLPHRVVEENTADAFAREVAEQMVAFGLLQRDSMGYRPAQLASNLVDVAG